MDLMLRMSSTHLPEILRSNQTNGSAKYEKLFGRQILKRKNLGNCFDSKAPSLKAFHNQKTNAETRNSLTRSLVKIILSSKA